MAFEIPLPPGCAILVLDDDTVLRKHLAAHRRSTSAEATRVLTAVLLAGFAAAGAIAQVSSSGGNAASGPPAPFPPVSQETPNRGPSLGPQWVRPPSTNILPGRSLPQNRTLGPFFLPTLLPVLGAAPPAKPASLAANYPRESAGEPFFMAEGNLAANQLLSAKHAERIASYRTARLTLLTELRAELTRGPELSTAVRERALADLAAAQNPRLLELEAEAENIRHELTHVELLKTTADDIGKLGSADENPKLKDALADVRLILSAAHFRDGFSSDQRRLLEEMAQEARLTIEPERGLGGQVVVFFWPAGARIPAPVGLGPGDAAKFDEFQRRKSDLKNDLRALLDREKRQVLNLDNTEDYALLAAAQAPRFAELDALADQLRPALAALAQAGAKPAAPLPAELARQVAALSERKAALQREVYARLTEFRRALPAERVELTRQDGSPAIAIMTDHGSRNDREEVLVGINAFNQEISARFAALTDQRDAVRDALARYQANAPGAKPDVTVDQLAADFLADYNAREYLNRQRDYRAAVLAPALSPAQRRLLLVAATVDTLPERPLYAP